MSLSKREREEMLAHCGEIHTDDGVDPRDFFRKSSGPKKADHKAHQLCRQVAETLDQILSGELGDDELMGLRVVQVVPAPDASRLLVTLAADNLRSAEERERVKSKLAACSGRLRREVAAAITRRKAPSLAFQIVTDALMDSIEEGDA